LRRGNQRFGVRGIAFERERGRFGSGGGHQSRLYTGRPRVARCTRFLRPRGFVHSRP
jgi:hypothetical protein